MGLRSWVDVKEHKSGVRPFLQANFPAKMVDLPFKVQGLRKERLESPVKKTSIFNFLKSPLNIMKNSLKLIRNSDDFDIHISIFPLVPILFYFFCSVHSMILLEKFLVTEILDHSERYPPF